MTTHTATAIRTALGLKCSRSKVPGGAWGVLERAVRYGDTDWMTRQMEQAVWGIDHSVSTGRLDHRAVDAIRAMSDWTLCGLIAEIADSCRVQGEVSTYLARRFAA
jgi:hypothetical protein